MTLSNFKLLGCLAILSLLPFTSSATPILSILPGDNSININTDFTVAITVSGLEKQAAPSLGVYDILFKYDPAYVTYKSITYGDTDPLIGDQLALNGISSYTSTTEDSNQLELYELSFNTSDELNNDQLDSFMLATLTFHTTALTTNSPLTLEVIALGDADGGELTMTIQNSTVTVKQPSGGGGFGGGFGGPLLGGGSGIPEPSTLWLIGMGFVSSQLRLKKWKN